MTVTPPLAASCAAVPSAPLGPDVASRGAAPSTSAANHAPPSPEAFHGPAACNPPAALWAPALRPPAEEGDAPAVPSFFLCDHGDGHQALLRYATVTADGRSENHFPSDMPEGAVVDYAMRSAVEAWSTQGAWQELATCPIGLHVFVDPVIAPDGHTYERRYLTDWLSKHDRSPKTQEPFLPADAAAPHTISVVSHARMRAFAAWVRAHQAFDDVDVDVDVDVDADGLAALACAPEVRSDIPVHMPAPANRAVPAANLRGAHMPRRAIPPPHVLQNPWQDLLGDPAWPLHGVFCVANVVFFSAALGAAMCSNAVARNVGCGLTFAAPLVGATSALTARYFFNRHRRTVGLPPL